MDKIWIQSTNKKLRKKNPLTNTIEYKEMTWNRKKWGENFIGPLYHNVKEFGYNYKYLYC